MKVLIIGATGFIGRTLVSFLLGKRYDITIITRNKQKAKMLFPVNISIFEWDHNSNIPLHFFKDIDIIVNLAGENIASKYWTKKQKDKILNSRIRVGKKISQAIKNLTKKPELLIQASAIGYYGHNISMKIDEDYSQGNGFLAQVSAQWEESSEIATNYGVQRAIIRTGIVLGKDGGMFPKLLLPIRYYMGSNLGKGKNWISWIHKDDLIAAIEFILKNHLHGTFNLTAPNPIMSKGLNKAIAKKIRRPVWITIPQVLLKLFLKDMANELILANQQIFPKKLTDAGFIFKYPTIDKALPELLENH